MRRSSVTSTEKKTSCALLKSVSISTVFDLSASRAEVRSRPSRILRSAMSSRIPSVAASTGLRTKSSAPADSTSSSACASWLEVVTRMKGIRPSGSSASMRRQTSSPSMPGRKRSSRTMSGVSSSRLRRASSPDEQATTW